MLLGQPQVRDVGYTSCFSRTYETSYSQRGGWQMKSLRSPFGVGFPFRVDRYWGYLLLLLVLSYERF